MHGAGGCYYETICNVAPSSRLREYLRGERILEKGLASAFLLKLPPKGESVHVSPLPAAFELSAGLMTDAK
jgi:hypothetical protein